MLRKFGIYITKSLILLLLATLIFSSVAIDIATLTGNLIGDVFEYSSPEAQKEVIAKLTSTCAVGDETTQIPAALQGIRSLCRDYNTGKINDRQFFNSVIGSMLPERMDGPQAGFMQRYNDIVEYLNSKKLIYFLALAALAAALYYLISDLKIFLITLSAMALSLGIFILAPYAAIIVYEKLVGIDTTPILSAIIGGSSSIDIKAIISVLLLMILRTYNTAILALGIICVSVGIAGKIYTVIAGRKKAKVANEKQKIH